MKSTRSATDALIDQTIDLWQPRSQRGISPEDARQVVENVTGFFNILAEWARVETGPKASDTDQSHPHLIPRGAR